MLKSVDTNAKVYQIKELTVDKMLKILENPEASVQELTLVVRWMKDNDIKIQVDEAIFKQSTSKKHIIIPSDLDDDDEDGYKI